MELRPVHSDEFEALMREVSEAARAGAFGSTKVDVEGLMARPVSRPSLRLFRFAVAGLPMAACLALFLGLAAFWKSGSPPSSGLEGNVSIGGTGSTPAERCETLENLRQCFSGPGVLARADCRCVDKDADGDVDLRDLGMFQLEEAGR